VLANSQEKSHVQAVKNKSFAASFVFAQFIPGTVPAAIPVLDLGYLIGPVKMGIFTGKQS
jgi:hypothetical protein